jgi:hypothetical protein
MIRCLDRESLLPFTLRARGEHVVEIHQSPSGHVLGGEYVVLRSEIAIEANELLRLCDWCDAIRGIPTHRQEP